MKTDPTNFKKSKIIIASCLVVLIPVLDQLTKYLVRTFMTVGETISVWGDFFHLTYILNDGMAFGKMGGAWRWVFMVLTPIALGAIAIVFIKFFEKLRPTTVAALSMIFAGGLSNMIDRTFFYNLDPASTGIFDGRVIDFFDFNVSFFGHRVWNAVFNVADAFVVVGVFLLIIMLIVDEVSQHKKKKAEAAGAAAETTAAETEAPADRHDEEATDMSLEGAETPAESEAPVEAAIVDGELGAAYGDTGDAGAGDAGDAGGGE